MAFVRTVLGDIVPADLGVTSMPSGTLTLLRSMVEDGLADRIVLGMDAARRGYLHAYGGRPGLAFAFADGAAGGTDGGAR
jgi:predicted metal-dependent phosphotriesterase family hydrolase